MLSNKYCLCFEQSLAMKFRIAFILNLSYDDVDTETRAQ